MTVKGVANTIKIEKENQNLSYGELTRRTGLSYTVINNFLEQGSRMRIDNVLRLIDAVECEIQIRSREII